MGPEEEVRVALEVRLRRDFAVQIVILVLTVLCLVLVTGFWVHVGSLSSRLEAIENNLKDHSELIQIGDQGNLSRIRSLERLQDHYHGGADVRTLRGEEEGE